MADTPKHDDLPEPEVKPGAPPAGGRQDHAAMRVDSMLPVSGPASTDMLAAAGGLNVPGDEPQSSAALTLNLSVTNPTPELITGAYEPDTATHRQPGAIGGRFNGEDSAGLDSYQELDERTAEERRREGGGGEHDRSTEAHDQRTRRR